MSKEARILIVDDFSTMRRIIKNILKQLGYHNTVEADDGSTALEKLRKDRIDLIISDWNMPGMHGIDLLRKVREDAELSSLPFLMVTAECKQDNILEAIHAGASNYIVKPFTAEVLERKLAKVLPG